VDIQEVLLEVQVARRKRRQFSEQFKAEAVELVRTSGKSVGQIAKDLDLTETSLREWVKQMDTAQAELTTLEREELAQLRRENKNLRMERDFLKKAAAFFAKDNS
jgi:transposase-like protein